MSVHDFTSWIRRTAARLSSPVMFFRRDQIAIDHLDTIHEFPHDTVPSQSGSWLSDGYRLRPRPAPPAKLAQLLTPKATPPNLAALKNQLHSGTPIALTRTDAPFMVPGHPANGDFPGQDGSRDMPGTIARFSSLDFNRMLAVRLLIYYGLYNEGFERAELPEQYRHIVSPYDHFEPPR